MLSAISSVRVAVPPTGSTSVRQRAVEAPRGLSSSSKSGHFAPASVETKRNVMVRASRKVNAAASPSKSQGQKKISAEEAKELYKDMFLGREFEEMCAQMYYRGKMFGFVHLYSGQEAVSTGMCHRVCWV